MEKDAGVEAIIAAFNNGWHAGASLQIGRSDRVAELGEGLQLYWLAGFHAAQSSASEAGPVGETVGIAPDRIGNNEPGHRLSHPITRALRAAYLTGGEAQSHASLAAILEQLG